MESAAPRTATAISAQEAPDLAHLLEQPDPVVTVVLETDPAVANAGERSSQRWKSQRDSLSAAGAAPDALDAIEGVVAEAHLDGPGLFVVAGADGIRFRESLPETPERDSATVGPLPRLAPLLDARQRYRPFIMVLADHTGADIVAVGPHGRAEISQAGDNDPHDPVIHKSAPGGWSQQRYQERAERSWEENATAVAERVSEVARLLDPAAILISGDVRALGYLRQHLDGQWSSLVTELHGSRSADSGGDELAEAARLRLASVAAEDTAAVLAKFREELGQHDRAAEGIAATLTALNESAVDTLLISDDHDDHRTAWCSPDSPVAWSNPDRLHDYGIEAPIETRLADVAIRSAFLSGARVRIVPSTTVAEGLGAILRYA